MNDVNILVVEDESLVAKDIQNRLKKFGYAVPTIVASGEEAIKQVTEFCPDLVLMDIQLKGKMDGIEAAQKINISWDIPVIYLTANADDTTLERLKRTNHLATYSNLSKKKN
jgi:CheY-like chemotaxis protein